MIVTRLCMGTREYLWQFCVRSLFAWSILESCCSGNQKQGEKAVGIRWGEVR